MDQEIPCLLCSRESLQSLLLGFLQSLDSVCRVIKNSLNIHQSTVTDDLRSSNQAVCKLLVLICAEIIIVLLSSVNADLNQQLGEDFRSISSGK